jgi:hypothetical protein
MADSFFRESGSKEIRLEQSTNVLIDECINPVNLVNPVKKNRPEQSTNVLIDECINPVNLVNPVRKSDRNNRRMY